MKSGWFHCFWTEETSIHLEMDFIAEVIHYWIKSLQLCTETDKSEVQSEFMVVSRKWKNMNWFHRRISAELNVSVSSRLSRRSTKTLPLFLRNIDSAGGIRVSPLHPTTSSDIIWSTLHLHQYPEWLGEAEGSKGTWTQHAAWNRSALRTQRHLNTTRCIKQDSTEVPRPLLSSDLTDL